MAELGRGAGKSYPTLPAVEAIFIFRSVSTASFLSQQTWPLLHTHLFQPLGWGTQTLWSESESVSSYVKREVGSTNLWGPFSTLAPSFNFVGGKKVGRDLKSFSCARGLSKLKPPKYSTKADQKTCSGKTQTKTYFDLGEKIKPSKLQRPETTTN